ncbi:nucleotidase-related [Holotrichia oblita]|uniref:Nucleotidase-related n=1 Tax=Holotrichia oblita TaxID=644536 RepID=A0ACB9SSU4_HOLOL|nr:nucleotidase-related [Holotrichia oblita]
MTPSMGTCKINASCIGGFSRMYTLINQLYQTRPNPISLNAGDNFQGTLWYNMFKWNVTQFFLNMLPTDAMTLGNHEFDDGLEGIVPFLKAIRVPVVLSNIDDTLEPSIQNLYKKSIVIEREGKKIGIIGVLTSGTKDVSNTGQLSFLDEVESINREARRLLDMEGVFTVIVISHCGFESETKMAKLVTNGISIIVGGHSNTLLYNGMILYI